MRALVVVTILAISLAAYAVPAAPAEAQTCDWFPSTVCPAPGRRGTSSYPCNANQIKGDWSSMTYHLPTQASYSGRGSAPSSDIWCFDDAQEAADWGFRRAYQ
jgi:hypothetical protein